MGVCNLYTDIQWLCTETLFHFILYFYSQNLLYYHTEYAYPVYCICARTCLTPVLLKILWEMPIISNACAQSGHPERTKNILEQR